MLFGRKKKKAESAKPATIKEALAQQDTEPEVEISEGKASEDDVAADHTATPEADESAAEEDSGSGSDSGTAAEPATEADVENAEEAEAIRKAATPPPGGHMPRDISDMPTTKGYLNFGAILVPGVKNQKVRMDIDQKTKRVVSLTITIGEASLQLQAFSAPKSGGTWDEVRKQIEESVVGQKGRVRTMDGRFGKELHARVPTTLKDGRKGWRAARFIGFEGNRWFLRGVIGGRGAIDKEAAKPAESLFAHLVVDRGNAPLPPRELLQLKAPAGAKKVHVQSQDGKDKNQSNGVREQPNTAGSQN